MAIDTVGQGIGSVGDALPCSHPAARQTLLFPAFDYITGDVFEVRRCDACGLARTFPRLPPAQLGRYYPQGYYGQNRRYPASMERCLQALYAVRSRAIQAASGVVGGTVLDIGCGRGELLDQMRRLGWSVAGTELSDASARYARDVLHIDVHVGDLEGTTFPDDRFSVVILWHVLEHVEHPEVLLHRVRNLLRPGGVLLVAVPNFSSIEARWGKDVWFHLDVPRHLNHFTPHVLERMLASAGLRMQSTSYFSLEYDAFSFVQTMLNWMGLRHNLLYNVLRTRGAKVLTPPREQRVRPPEVALHLLLATILGGVSLIWVPLVARLGRGATVTLYARKPSASDGAA